MRGSLPAVHPKVVSLPSSIIQPSYLCRKTLMPRPPPHLPISRLALLPSLLPSFVIQPLFPPFASLAFLLSLLSINLQRSIFF